MFNFEQSASTWEASCKYCERNKIYSLLKDFYPVQFACNSVTGDVPWCPVSSDSYPKMEFLNCIQYIPICVDGQWMFYRYLIILQQPLFTSFLPLRLHDGPSKRSPPILHTGSPPNLDSILSCSFWPDFRFHISNLQRTMYWLKIYFTH